MPCRCFWCCSVLRIGTCNWSLKAAWNFELLRSSTEDSTAMKPFKSSLKSKSISMLLVEGSASRDPGGRATWNQLTIFRIAFFRRSLSFGVPILNLNKFMLLYIPVVVAGDHTIGGHRKPKPTTKRSALYYSYSLILILSISFVVFRIFV